MKKPVRYCNWLISNKNAINRYNQGRNLALITKWKRTIEIQKDNIQRALTVSRLSKTFAVGDGGHSAFEHEPKIMNEHKSVTKVIKFTLTIITINIEPQQGYRMRRSIIY